MKRLTQMLAVLALAAIALPAMAKEGDGAPKNKQFTGEVTKAELDKVTLVARGDSGEKTESFTVNDSTKIWLPGDPAAATTDGKEGGKRIPPKAGKIEDVKVGDRARCEYTADNVAVAIHVLPPKAAKVGGEGTGSTTPTPKVNKEGGEAKTSGEGAVERKKEGRE